MKRYILAAILFISAPQLVTLANTEARELDAYDYTILAQETDGQCASPGAKYGCRYDSNITIPAPQ
jgi:hypothetical protein